MGRTAGFTGKKLLFNLKTWEISERALLQWITKGDANFWAMQRIEPMTISLRHPLPTSELQSLDMKNIPFYWPTRAPQSYAFADLIVKFFILVFFVKKSIPMCFFHACEAIWEHIWKYFTLGATKPASIVRLVSPKECDLFESSVLSSSSTIVSSLMLQQSCNLTPTLFIRWLWVCTTPRCHNNKVFPEALYHRWLHVKKFCLPLVVSGTLNMCLEKK